MRAVLLALFCLRRTAAGASGRDRDGEQPVAEGLGAERRFRISSKILFSIKEGSMLQRRTVQPLVAVFALIAMLCQGTLVLAGTTGTLSGT